MIYLRYSVPDVKVISIIESLFSFMPMSEQIHNPSFIWIMTHRKYRTICMNIICIRNFLYIITSDLKKINSIEMNVAPIYVAEYQQL